MLKFVYRFIVMMIIMSFLNGTASKAEISTRNPLLNMIAFGSNHPFNNYLLNCDRKAKFKSNNFDKNLLSNHYRTFGSNYLAMNEINTLVFSAKIRKVLQSEKYKFDIIYLNNNRVISLFPNKNYPKKIQIIIAFENGKILPLNFRLADIPGKLMYISDRNFSYDTYSHNVDSTDYGNNIKEIIRIMEQVIQDDEPESTWIPLDGISEEIVLSKILTAKIYKKWLRDKFILELWKLCSKSNAAQKIEVRDILIKKINVAYTLETDQLQPNSCVKLVALSSNYKNKY